MEAEENGVNALAMRPTTEMAEYDVSDVVAQAQKIQKAMKAVMKDGEHYGLIPGCGKKPSLLKAGAEKLAFMFRLAPRFTGEREATDLGNGHREYVIRCELYHIPTDRFVGAGLGSCSTMEAKYRYRSGPKEFTGRPVPSGYWDMRNSNPAGARAMLGGDGYGVAKNDSGSWEIVQQGERIEHDNPADHYNTVLKMAKKRAQVDATLTVTAASDFFTQDVEDLSHEVRPDEAAAPEIKPPQRTAPAQVLPVSNAEAAPQAPAAWQPAPATTANAANLISEPQRKRFYAIHKGRAVPDGEVKAKLQEYGYEHSTQIEKKDYEALCKWAGEWTQTPF